MNISLYLLDTSLYWSLLSGFFGKQAAFLPQKRTFVFKHRGDPPDFSAMFPSRTVVPPGGKTEQFDQDAHISVVKMHHCPI